MHSFTGPSGRAYNHNGDFSGDVVITDLDHTINSQYGYPRIEIPFEDIRALYLAYLRSREISRLESASDDELERRLTGMPPEVPEGPEAADTPSQGVPDWVAEAKRNRARITAHGTLAPTTELAVGGVYVFHNNAGILAKITELPEDGSVRFAVWNADVPWAWQQGAGCGTHELFRQMYPQVYTGPDPVAEEPPLEHR